MAQRARNSVLSLLFIGVLACVATHWMLSPRAETFLQPRAPKASEASAALGSLAALTASLPAEAYKGPLTGSEACLPTSKPLVWIIAPLCDPIYLISPIYMYPILLTFFFTIVTTINLLIPATQPDEDLRA